MQTQTWAHTHKHAHRYLKHSGENCLDFGSEDQTPHVSKTSLLNSTRSWAARRRNKVEKRGESCVEKVKTKVGKTVRAAIPNLYLCERAPTEEAETIWQPWVCYRRNPDFFIIHHCSRAVPSLFPDKYWGFMRGPEVIRKIMSRGRGMRQSRKKI